MERDVSFIPDPSVVTLRRLSFSVDRLFCQTTPELTLLKAG